MGRLSEAGSMSDCIDGQMRARGFGQEPRGPFQPFRQKEIAECLLALCEKVTDISGRKPQLRRALGDAVVLSGAVMTDMMHYSHEMCISPVVGHQSACNGSRRQAREGKNG